MTPDEFMDLWRITIMHVRDYSVHPIGFYATGADAPSTTDDYKLCQKDAAAGNPRAIKYMTEFAKQRLKG